MYSSDPAKCRSASTAFDSWVAKMPLVDANVNLWKTSEVSYCQTLSNGTALAVNFLELCGSVSQHGARQFAP